MSTIFMKMYLNAFMGLMLFVKLVVLFSMIPKGDHGEPAPTSAPSVGSLLLLSYG
jgi:hypothetical protein